MGFFSNRGASANTGSDVNLLENCEAIEPKYENFDEAALASIVEAEENYNNIMQAVGVDELDFFEENGFEMVYTTEAASGFFGKVKEFFMNLYQKIKGLFQKFVSLIDSYTKSDKDFVNKYRKHLLSANTKDFEYKGFEFTHLDAGTEKSMTKAQEQVGLGNLENIPGKEGNEAMESKIKGVEDRSEIVEKMRGAAVSAIGGGSASGLEAGEFSKELFMVFRKGEDSKVNIEKVNVSEQLSTILNAADTKKKAEKAFSDLEKTINNAIKALDKAEKEAVKDAPSKDSEGKATSDPTNGTYVSLIGTYIYFIKEKLSIGQTVNGALLTALKDQNRQAKSICVSLMNYKPKHESVGSLGESAVGGSLLGNVTIK
jgi:hypothetical protein